MRIKDGNWVNLDNLPHKNGKLLWCNCSGERVDFCYRGVEDTLYVLKQIDEKRVLIRYRDSCYELYKNSVRYCSLGRLFNFAVANNYKYDENQVIDNYYKIVSHKRLRHGPNEVKAYEILCLKCNNTFDVSEVNLDRGDRCPYCSHHKVIVGKTDLWTTNPEVAKLLKNKDDGYKYAALSNRKAEFVCLKCGQDVGAKVIASVTQRGLGCQFCGRGKSYPNKFMYNLLKSLGVSFEMEKRFDWCTFPNFDRSYVSFGIYDFVIEDQKLIIEMDGGLGHGSYVIKTSYYSVEDTAYRDEIKDKLAIEHGYKIIRIKCDYKKSNNRFQTCRIAIEKSNLAKIYDLNDIDWSSIDKQAQGSVLLDICELYNQGFSSGEISEMIDYDLSSVIDYLHKGHELSLCNYIPQKIRRKN